MYIYIKECLLYIYLYCECFHQYQGLIFLEGRTILVNTMEASSNYFCSYTVPRNWFRVKNITYDNAKKVLRRNQNFALSSRLRHSSIMQFAKQSHSTSCKITFTSIHICVGNSSYLKPMLKLMKGCEFSLFALSANSQVSQVCLLDYCNIGLLL